MQEVVFDDDDFGVFVEKLLHFMVKREPWIWAICLHGKEARWHRSILVF